MTVSLKHAFQSAKADSGDATLVQPSNWNAEHTLVQATGKLLGRSTAGDGATEEITVGSGLSLAAGTLSASGGGGTQPSQKYLSLHDGFSGALDLAGDTVVEQISLTIVNFETVDVSGCTALVRIDMANNGILSIDVSNCAALTDLHCAGNNFETVDVTDCTSLNDLDCSNGILTEAGVDAILAALDVNGVLNGEVDLSGGTSAPPSATGLTAKTSLEGKGWTVTVNS